MIIPSKSYIYIPEQKLTGYKGLVGLFYGNKKFEGTNNYCCNYLVEDGTQSKNNILNHYGHSIGGPLNTEVIGSGDMYGGMETFTFRASKESIRDDWTAEQYIYWGYNRYVSWRILLMQVGFGGMNVGIESINQVNFYGTQINLTGKLSKYTWTHIAIEYEAKTNLMFLYINGRLSNTVTPDSTTVGGPSVSLPNTGGYWSPMDSQQIALWGKRISGGAESFELPSRYMDDNGNWLF